MQNSQLWGPGGTFTARKQYFEKSRSKHEPPKSAAGTCTARKQYTGKSNAQELDYETIMINCNPETVSTD